MAKKPATATITTYNVHSPVRLHIDDYVKGDSIDLDDVTAAQLLAVGAVELPPAPKVKA